jgi:hypothetical protein
MENLPSTLIKALKAREVIPFAGAGVPHAVTDDSGRRPFPTWRGLLLAASERLRWFTLRRQDGTVLQEVLPTMRRMQLHAALLTTLRGLLATMLVAA